MPKWAPGQTLASLGPANPKYWHLFVEAKKLAFNDLYAFNADPNFSKVPLERLLSKAHAESLCGKVDPNRAAATKAGGNAESDGDTIVLSTADRFGNMVAWVNSLYDGLRLRPHRPGLRHHAAQPRRLVHARSEEPECDRAAQASVQHAVCRLRHAQRQAADDGDVDGRRRAGARHRAGAGEHPRPRRQPAGCIGHGALSSHSGAEHADDGIAAGQARRRAVEGDGARGASRSTARRWADSRPSWWRRTQAFIAPARIIARTGRRSGTSASEAFRRARCRLRGCA